MNEYAYDEAFYVHKVRREEAPADATALHDRRIPSKTLYHYQHHHYQRHHDHHHHRHRCHHHNRYCYLYHLHYRYPPSPFPSHPLQVLEGVDVTVFAYGATGAGKTHTMMGNSRRDATTMDENGNTTGGGEVNGIIPQSLVDIFQMVKQREAAAKDVDTDSWEVSGPRRPPSLPPSLPPILHDMYS